MKRAVFILLFGTFFFASFGQGAKKAGKTATPGSFVSYRYTELPLSATKPKGWLLHQLQIMRDGTTGHLDEVYNKVKRDNGWLICGWPGGDNSGRRQPCV